jgi:hypothetical protein
MSVARNIRKPFFKRPWTKSSSRHGSGKREWDRGFAAERVSDIYESPVRESKTKV